MLQLFLLLAFTTWLVRRVRHVELEPGRADRPREVRVSGGSPSSALERLAALVALRGRRGSPSSRFGRCSARAVSGTGWVVLLAGGVLAQGSPVGKFGTRQVVASTAVEAQWVIAADLDGDGDRDLLSAWADLAWYENTGGPSAFGPAQVLASTPNGFHSVFAADLDGDGDQDVLSSRADEVAWHENTDGLGGFGPEQVIQNAGLDARQVSAADLDGDGDLDVLLASEALSVLWYENTGGLGTFGPQQVVTSAAPSAFSAFATDVDGDGDLDVLSATEIGQVAWSENTDGLGAFGPQQVITSTVPFAYTVCAADLDGDGDQDAISAESAVGEVVWYENAGGLGDSWSRHLITNVAQGASSAYAADLDGDGDRDVLSSSYSDDTIAWYENNLDTPSLEADVDVVSLSAGGAQSLTLVPGAGNAFAVYVVLTTTSGVTPGLVLFPSSFLLPLNDSGLLQLTLKSPNLLIPSSLGFLDGNGERSLALTLPPGLDPGLAGVTLHSAYALVDPFSPLFNQTFTSNAVALTLVP